MISSSSSSWGQKSVESSGGSSSSSNTATSPPPPPPITGHYRRALSSSSSSSSSNNRSLDSPTTANNIHPSNQTSEQPLTANITPIFGTNCLRVLNLDSNIRETDLYTLFTKFGPVTEIRMIGADRIERNSRSRSNSSSCGRTFAFVVFADRIDAIDAFHASAAALASKRLCHFDGRPVEVRFSRILPHQYLDITTGATISAATRSYDENCGHKFESELSPNLDSSSDGAIAAVTPSRRPSLLTASFTFHHHHHH